MNPTGGHGATDMTDLNQTAEHGYSREDIRERLAAAPAYVVGMLLARLAGSP